MGEQENATSLMDAYAKLAPTAMRDLFNSVDSDGNGTLDKDEVARFVRKLKPTRFLAGDAIDQAMAEMDSDGDGSVTYEEFEAWWLGGGSITAGERVATASAQVGNSLQEALKQLENCRNARSNAAAVSKS